MRDRKLIPFSPDYQSYLKGKYFGVLNDCEKGKDYNKLLDSIIIDLFGLHGQINELLLTQLFLKTNSLKYLNYAYLRPVIMDCMALVDKIGTE